MNELPVVTVLGLGAMGHAFAANLVKKGFTVSGWNRTRQRGEDLERAGLRLCDTPHEAVRGADVIIAMLTDAAITESVLVGKDGIVKQAKSGAVVVQMGTIGLVATDRISAAIAAARADVVFLDAPVSGTKAPAEQALITILASGERERAAAVRPVFDAIAKSTRWLGAAGAGSRMKLVVNAWLISMVQGMTESVQLAEKLGFAPENVWQCLDGGPLAAPYVKNKLAAIEAGDYTPQMQLSLALKDARLALDAAGELSMPGLRTIAELWQDAVADGLGEQDIIAIHRYLNAHR
ncbi:NAD(P)-dependent oxidoreductase [Martelella alba]|uniref:NAD(P)-dependent oxidoreductase n=1 Tax=Martelella alba TaxID=2590451 RepID=A0ABY2SS86_9HYPH|nr:NAD(P)-dependent oxidoreductase [Martelella alba]TKI07783.1 NAD(P)-dependent oxidoreductase [Martelella alba]